MAPKKFRKPVTTETEPIKSSLPSNDTKPLLSKSVMSMKFMARKVEEKQQEKEQAMKRRKLNEADWTTGETSSHLPEDRLVCCEIDENVVYQSCPGRRSFGGCNSIVERQYAQLINSDRLDRKMEKRSKHSTVSDEEMLERYDTLIGLPRGPSQGVMAGKRKSGNKNSVK
mmetsp:Transcript_22678/g.33144  ORF Transcript_22678/g.33144 Transcript_22678/m.33144 type:complete len:170 (-) Transcript_22678:171-680(-)